MISPLGFCGYLHESQPDWSSPRVVRNDKVAVVDRSALFSRPGPRFVEELEILPDLTASYQMNVSAS